MKKSLGIALIVFLVALMAVMMITDKQEQDRRETHIQELQKEARPYEFELNQIRSELQNREKEIKSTPDISSVIIGFVPTCADDIAVVKELTEDYDFTPIIILDCSMDESVLHKIINKSVAENYEMIAAGMTFDTNVLKRADTIKTLLTKYGDKQESAFFLRSICDTVGNREDLKQHGYKNLVRYSESLISEVDNSGVPCICYAFIKPSVVNSDLVSQVAAACSYTVLTFDFSDIHSGDIGKTDITELLTIIENQVSAGKLLYKNLTEAFNDVVELESLSQQHKEEYEQYKTEKQKRIDGLEEIIDEIYSHRDEY